MNSNIKKIYENYAEYDRLIKHRMEFYINLRFIKENLPTNKKQLKILDLGGGVGRYSIELTKLGHEVTLIDLADRNIREAKKLCEEEGIDIFSIKQGDALDLSEFKDNSFDVVLVMAPFYHLLKEEERNQCINESKRVLKNDNGVFFSAHLTRYAFYKYVVANLPERIDEFDENFVHVFETGLKKYNDGDNFTDNAYCDNAEHVIEFMENHGFSDSEIIVSEGLVDHIEDKLNNLEEEKFLKIAELNYNICKDTHILNAGSHLLYKGMLK